MSSKLSDNLSIAENFCGFIVGLATFFYLGLKIDWPARCLNDNFDVGVVNCFKDDLDSNMEYNDYCQSSWFEYCNQCYFSSHIHCLNRHFHSAKSNLSFSSLHKTKITRIGQNPVQLCLLLQIYFPNLTILLVIGYQITFVPLFLKFPFFPNLSNFPVPLDDGILVIFDFSETNDPIQ